MSRVQTTRMILTHRSRPGRSGGERHRTRLAKARRASKPCALHEWTDRHRDHGNTRPPVSCRACICGCQARARSGFAIAVLAACAAGIAATKEPRHVRTTNYGGIVASLNQAGLCGALLALGFIAAGCASEADSAAQAVCNAVERESDENLAWEEYERGMDREARNGIPAASLQAAVEDRCGETVAALQIPDVPVEADADHDFGDEKLEAEPEDEPELMAEPLPAPDDEPELVPEPSPPPEPQPAPAQEPEQGSNGWLPLGTETACTNYSTWDPCTVLEVRVDDACRDIMDFYDDLAGFDTVVSVRVQGTLENISSESDEMFGTMLWSDIYPRIFGGDGVVYDSEQVYVSECMPRPDLYDSGPIHMTGIEQIGWVYFFLPESALDGGRLEVGYHSWDWSDVY